MHAQARFEITSWEPTPWLDGEDVKVTPTAIAKTFTGEIEGTSQTRALFAQTGASQPLAYFAFERFDVSVGGRRGTFVLQHAAGAEAAEWTILPGSGTGELAGIEGRAEIVREDDGGHRFTLEYEVLG